MVATNSPYPNDRVSFSTNSFVQVGGSVLRMNIYDKNSSDRKSAKRDPQPIRQ
jgi:hypothetical protein